MNSEHILCAVTDDDEAQDVIDTGRVLASATGLTPVFATVAEVDITPPPTIIPAGVGISAPFAQGAYHAAERRAAERAAEFLASLDLADEETQICTGSPARGLHDLARELDVRAIVVGAARRGLSALVVGSVARWLSTNGGYPVVFARPRDQLRAEGPVVCGIDTGSEDASQVAAVAARLAESLDQELVLVHVGRFGPSEERDVLGYESRFGDRRGGAEEALERIRGSVPADVRTEAVVDEGPEVERLAAQAERRGAALVVTGNRGRGPIRSALVGSTSLELARSAPAPVVVVPPNAGGRR